MVHLEMKYSESERQYSDDAIFSSDRALIGI